MSQKKIFAKFWLVDSLSLLALGLGLLTTYILLGFYCDIEEKNLKATNSNSDNEDLQIDKKRRRKLKSQSEKITCEICLSDVTSAISAIEGGATSIELCTSRGEGGITPFIGLIQEVVFLSRGKSVEIHVLIRPRPGNFVYSAVEFDVITRDIIAAKNAGVDGIVIGILLANGQVDEFRMGVVRSLCLGLTLTFHRAFEFTTDPIRALESIIKLGCDRLLTSAQSNSALSGAVQLKELVAVAGDRIQVIAASGIGADNAFEIIMKSRVSGIHAGSSVHEINIPVTDHDDEAGTSDVGLSVYNPSDAATIEGVDQENERPPRSVISGLSESFECVSTTRVQKLASVANTAWLLLSLEKGDPPVDSPPAITALEVLCTAPSNEEKEDYGIISKATSADFSDDAFIELNPSKASIETSYVHVDSKLESKKKQSWFSYGGIGL